MVEHILGRLLLGCHTLRGREGDAAKDDLPAPGVGGIAALLSLELAGRLSLATPSSLLLVFGPQVLSKISNICIYVSFHYGNVKGTYR